MMLVLGRADLCLYCALAESFREDRDSSRTRIIDEDSSAEELKARRLSAIAVCIRRHQRYKILSCDIAAPGIFEMK